jgi:hypothetical protein
MVCLLFHQASSEARSDEAAMKSRRLRALFTQVRGTRILGSWRSPGPTLSAVLCIGQGASWRGVHKIRIMPHGREKLARVLELLEVSTLRHLVTY